MLRKAIMQTTPTVFEQTLARKVMQASDIQFLVGAVFSWMWDKMVCGNKARPLKTNTTGYLESRPCKTLVCGSSMAQNLINNVIPFILFVK